MSNVSIRLLPRTLRKVHDQATDEVASNAHQLRDACDDGGGARVPVPEAAQHIHRRQLIKRVLIAGSIS